MLNVAGNQKVSLFSVPESSLCIFSLCLKITIRAIRHTNILKYKVWPKTGINEIAEISVVASIVPKETYRVKAIIVTKKPRHKRAITQSIINSTATAVSAPFPPLKLKYIGQLCPITAPAPATNRLKESSPLQNKSKRQVTSQYNRQLSLLIYLL